MEQKRVPWVFILLAFFAASQTPKLLPSKEDPKAEGTNVAQIGESKDSSTQKDEPSWNEPLRLYREFLGLLPAPKATGKTTFAEVFSIDGRTVNVPIETPEEDVPSGQESTLRSIHDRSCDRPERSRTETEDPGGTTQERRVRMEFLIALVPDPLDTNLALEFDQGLDGIQLAFAENQFLLDRYTLPWAGPDSSSHLYRNAPGLLLFRKDISRIPPGDCSMLLSSVLLVGESPKQGVHKEAFLSALRLVRALQGESANGDAVRIVGPTMSGSAYSVRQSLDQWYEELLRKPKPLAQGASPAKSKPISQPTARSEAQAPTDTLPQAIHFISGTATSAYLSTFLAFELGKHQPGKTIEVTFDRTALADDDLNSYADQGYFARQGWEWSRFVRLSESDTAFGQASENKSGEPAVEGHFPSGLAQIRSAWEEEERARRQPNRLLSILPKSAFDFNLEGKASPIDIVPQLGHLTVPNSDAALSNLLDRLRWEGVRYVSIKATDTEDRIFLAKHVRRALPGAILVLNGNFLLYAHGDVGSQLEGTLVLNTFPLSLETEDWSSLSPRSIPKTSPPQPTGPYRRQFASSFQQGSYHAARSFLEGQTQCSVCPRLGWVSAVGGGKLWPIVLLGPGPQVEDSLRGLGFVRQERRNDLLLLGILIGLFLLAYQLRALRRPPTGRGRAWPDAPAFRYMVWFGAALLAAMSGMVLLVITLPLWHLDERLKPAMCQTATSACSIGDYER